MRLLHRLGQQLDLLGDGPVLALVGDLLLRPGLQDDVEALGQHLAALVHRHAEADELVRLVGAPHAEVEPAVGEDVDEGEVGRGAQGMVEGDRAHRHADADLLRALGDGRRVDLRGGDEAVGGEQVLGDPHLVVAELLGQLEEAQIVVEALDHLCQVRELAQAEYAELRLGHGASSRSGCVHAIVSGAAASVKPQSCGRTMRQRHGTPAVAEQSTSSSELSAVAPVVQQGAVFGVLIAGQQERRRVVRQRSPPAMCRASSSPPAHDAITPKPEYAPET